MNIEKEIFKRTNVDFKKLEDYGFKKEKNYIIEKIFLNNGFKAIITIDNNGNVTGKVIDLEVNEEYLNLRTDATGEFVEKVRNAYKDILMDIKTNCFDTKYFIFDQTNRINNYIKNKYEDEPEFLWKKFPGFGVYRNKNNNKWYSIIMNLDFSKLDNKSGEVEIMNVKVESNKLKELLSKEGIYEAYHMKKTDWISIVLNDTLKDEEIIMLIDKSYNLVK